MVELEEQPSTELEKLREVQLKAILTGLEITDIDKLLNEPASLFLQIGAQYASMSKMNVKELEKSADDHAEPPKIILPK